MNAISLETLLSVITRSVQKANSFSSGEYLEDLKRYFDGQGNPQVTKVALGENVLEVPTFCLVPHQGIAIKELELQFDTRISEVSDNEVWVDFTPAPDTGGIEEAKVNIKVVFKTTGVSEAALRINDKLIDTL
jgi:hypothetical protein